MSPLTNAVLEHGTLLTVFVITVSRRYIVLSRPVVTTDTTWNMQHKHTARRAARIQPPSLK